MRQTVSHIVEKTGHEPELQGSHQAMSKAGGVTSFPVKTGTVPTHTIHPLQTPELLRLNVGIFVLHMVQMAMFLVLPPMIVAAGLLCTYARIVTCYASLFRHFIRSCRKSILYIFESCTHRHELRCDAARCARCDRV